jgi:flagellar P-ring protein precursor FlgI
MGSNRQIIGRLAPTAAALFLAAAAAVPAAVAQPARIKDLANIRGVRDNYLVGFGLVVGLKGTGDSKKSLATNRAIAAMLTRLGMKTDSEEIVSGNIAAVMATGDLPPFARNGDTLDVKISAVGDASSLAGGTLIMTPMKAGNSEIFAVAQGTVVVGQASGAGAQVLTVARVPGGAVVEREFKPALAQDGKLTLSLKNADFTTATRMSEAINSHFKGFYATAEDVASIAVAVPPLYETRLVEFVAELEGLTVEADAKAVVVLNERTGTVVMGSQVVIEPVSVAHGELSIRVGGAKAKGKAATDKTVVGVGGATVGELIDSLNALGVKPADLVGILQTIHAAGALQDELKFM